MTSTARRPRAPWRLLLVHLGGTAVLAALFWSVYGEQAADAGLVAGLPSPLSFVTPVDLEVVDEDATQVQRQTVREQIAEVYTLDVHAQRRALAALATASLPEPALRVLQDAYGAPAGVRESEIAGLLEAALAALPAGDGQALGPLLARYMPATSIPSSTLTEAARSAAAAAVEPVMQTVDAGQVIVREGEPLTAAHLAMLQAAGLYDERRSAFRETGWIVAGCVLLGALLSLILGQAAARLLPSLTSRQALFVAGLTIVTIVAQRMALGVSPSFLFVVVIALAMAVLASEAAAAAWGIWSVVVVALLMPEGAGPMLVAGMAGALVGARVAAMQRSRPSLLFAGFAAGVVGAVALTALALLTEGRSAAGVAEAAGYLILGGALAGLLSMALVPLAEHSFGFLTDFRLSELSNPSSPLLQRLLLEAPGTYQHSLIISNLVEQAVKRIGGNALLARVGALYHDVGKLKRPSFFVENQFTTDNPHDRLSPHLSYLIITAHVRDGIDLLREYGLPAELEDFVLQHHGTTILSYFYKRALEDTPSLDELSFRYPGPRPRSKEVAVLMLADAVESASRTITDTSPTGLRAAIERIVDQRLRDGQLADANLNFDDLEAIKDTFERMLTAILHRRIAYPTAEEIGRLRRNGTQRPAVADRPAPVQGATRGLQRMDS